MVGSERAPNGIGLWQFTQYLCDGSRKIDAPAPTIVWHDQRRRAKTPRRMWAQNPYRRSKKLQSPTLSGANLPKSVNLRTVVLRTACWACPVPNSIACSTDSTMSRTSGRLRSRGLILRAPSIASDPPPPSRPAWRCLGSAVWGCCGGEHVNDRRHTVWQPGDRGRMR